MSKTAISQYSATPSSNSDVDGIDISEGCPASNLNNAQRSLMSHLKEMDDGTSALTSPSMGQLNVDNLRLDGNTISSTDTNGNVQIDPAGTGVVDVVGTLQSDGLTVDGDVTLNDGSPNLRLKDTDTNRFVDLLYGTRVATFRNTMASGEDMDTVEPSMVFSFKDDGETRTAMTIDHDGKVGIGTSTIPTADSMVTVRKDGAANEFNILSGTSHASVINMGDADDYNIQRIKADNSSNSLQFQTNNAERMRIDSGGQVFIGATSNASTESLLVKSRSNGNRAITASGLYASGGSVNIQEWQRSDGTVRAAVQYDDPIGGFIFYSPTGHGVTYSTSSDYRLKENVTYDWDATTRLKQLKPARFNFIIDADTVVDGFLAHEAQTVVPEAITGTHNEVEVWKEGEELPDGVSFGDNKLDEDGNTIPKYQGIDQAKLVPLLVKTIQELEARITALEAE